MGGGTHTCCPTPREVPDEEWSQLNETVLPLLRITSNPETRGFETQVQQMGKEVGVVFQARSVGRDLHLLTTFELFPRERDEGASNLDS